MDHSVNGAAIFARAEPRVVAAVTERLLSVGYRSGQLIFAEGQPGDRLYIVASGKIAITQRSPSGQQNLQAVLGPLDIFGELSVFDPGPRTSSATALTLAQVMSMDRSELRHVIAHYPEITQQLLRILARRLRRTSDRHADLVFTDVPGRVAKQLLQLAQQFGSQQDGAMRVSHDLTQEEIAQLVGAGREAVNKALTDFARRGWIHLEAKAVLIVDSTRLMQRASSSIPGPDRTSA
jgi:CRP/FNR family cyclic AMP-dependent transcriptional regulator